MKNDTYSYVALGSFDGLHKGHLSLIKKTVELAKKINGMSIVYTFKNHPRKFIKSIDNPKLLLDNESKKEILKKENVDLVYCDAKQIDENGKILHESYLRYKNMPILNEKYKKDILPFSRHIAIGCSQLLTKQVRNLMIPFSKNTIAHDWHSLYIANKLKGVYCIDKPLFEYRLHGNNAFGGRNFKQNIKIWKEKNGNTYKSYLKYRYRAITETYLAGVLMCKDYNSEQNKEEEDVIKYFENAQKAKILYLPIHKYFKYLYFKGMKKRKYKEITILHFPLIGYIVFKMSF